MASIAKDPNGFKRILFVDRDGKRQTIRLGKCSLRNAEAVKVRVEALAASLAYSHPPDDETLRWAAGLNATLAKRLAKVGLIPKREKVTLGPFLDRYVESRSDVKGSTKVIYGHTIRNLKDYFGDDKDLRQITEGDAVEWSRWLASEQGLSPQTVRRRCGLAKQYFGHAVKKRIIDRDPFAELKAATGGNPEKFCFITQETTDQIIAACPDAQWQAIIALARYGGLRCPSEILTLTWDRVYWDRVKLPKKWRIKVYSPKTEHHEGGAFREIPLFTELWPYLNELWEQREPGENRVITRYEYNGRNTNLRTQFQKIIRRAGVEPWPKLWQNLRSSRETELTKEHGLHNACGWIGNTPQVAREHYLQTTDADFEAAVENGAQSGAHSAHRRAQQRAAENIQDRPEETQPQKAKPLAAVSDRKGPLLYKSSVGVTGFEPVTSAM